MIRLESLRPRAPSFGFCSREYKRDLLGSLSACRCFEEGFGLRLRSSPEPRAVRKRVGFRVFEAYGFRDLVSGFWGFRA